MIKKTQKNASPRKPRAAVLAQENVTHVTGGDPGGAKIRETAVAD